MSSLAIRKMTDAAPVTRISRPIAAPASFRRRREDGEHFELDIEAKANPYPEVPIRTVWIVIIRFRD